MGVSPSAFRKWLKGEAEPSRERLVALATAAKVGIGWLASGEGSEPEFETMASSRQRQEIERGDFGHFIRLPRRATAASAGAGTPAVPEWAEGEYIALRQDWVRNAIGVEPTDIGLEVALGDSMTPTIHDGNMLLLDTSERGFTQFGIYVLEVSGERLVKRVQRKLDGSVVLISDNRSYEHEYLSPEQAQDMRVIGRVVWVGGRV
jgi:phage repressor protein C with HTH and peptisase S24 domain